MTVLSLLTGNASHSWGNQSISLITWYKLLSASKDIRVMLSSRRVDYLSTQRKEEEQINNFSQQLSWIPRDHNLLNWNEMAEVQLV